MKKVKKFIGFLFIVLFIFICFLVFNTYNFKSKQISVKTITPINIHHSAIEHLSEAIQIKTISNENSAKMNTSEFDKFSTFLKETYPLTDSLLHKKTFNNYSHLYFWQGVNTSLKPIVLMAHIDVVPTIEKNKNLWTEDPFSGLIKNNIIWGRGAIDDKVSVIGILEATESLLKQGFTPNRSVYITLGHDEEIGGLNGALVIANYLEEKNVDIEFVLDEGGVITQGLVPGIEKEVAIIGIAEKGFISVELSVEIEGGHSSMPAKETAIDVISNAVVKLKNNPFPARITEPLSGFINFVGPEMPFVNKLVFANAGIFESVITGIYEKQSSTNAMVRTTTSPTIFNSGIKENIIPLTASATVNFRILSGDTSETVIKHVKNIINDPRITLSYSNFFSEPSKVSPTDSFGFKTIHKTIAEIFGDVIISPTLVVGGTDSKHFKNVTSNIYRFTPIHINSENIKSFHGINERISVEDFENAIRFYVQIIKNSTLN